MEFAFVPNVGQWPHSAAFIATQKYAAVSVENDRFSVRVGRGDDAKIVSMRFVDAEENTRVVGEDPREETYNYFLGNDPKCWRTDVTAFSAVRYQEPYAGVDVRLKSSGSHLEYDLILQPRADLQRIAIEAEGIDDLKLASDGSMIMKSGDAEFRQTPPRTWQVSADHQKNLLASSFELLGGNRFAISVPNRNPSLMTVIDPGLEWSTYLGGSGRDEIKAMMLDAAGDVIVAGVTESPEFVTTPGAYDRTHGAHYGCTSPISCGDGFVTKLSHDGQRVIWSTFLGGTNVAGNDAIRAMAFDSQGNIVLGGNTSSSWQFPIYPVPGAYRTNSTVQGGQTEVFISKISGRGNALLYSTFFGGTRAGNRLTSLAVDSQDAAVFGGTTIGGLPTFPNPGAFQTALNCSSTSGGGVLVDPTGGTGGGGNNAFGGGNRTNSSCGGDGFIARITMLAQGTADLTYCTYLGGTNYDSLTGLVVNADDSVIATGFTNSCDFPTTPNALSEHPRSPDLCPQPLMDGFVTRLRMQGSGRFDLMYSTYVGGYDNDYIYGISLASPAVVALTGATFSWDFPITQDAFSTSITNLPGLKADAFALLLDTTPGVPPFSQVNYGTYLGGDETDSGQVIVTDPVDGSMMVAGFTESTNFPRSGDPFQPQFVGGSTISQDVFVSRIVPRSRDRADLVYSTYLGGVGWDNPNAIAFEASNNVIVSGFTATGGYVTNDFPLQRPYDAIYGSNVTSDNNRDGFITKLVLPTDVSIRVVPQSPDVAPGGLLAYDVILTNNTSDPQTVGLKVDAYASDGSPYSGNPIDRPRDLSLTPNQTVTVNFAHRIPSSTHSPSGPYSLRAKISPYTPGPTQGVASFTFMVR
ncbi:MAG: hypothetical protein HYR85_18520 [Planctomycetes bacterium]|nr:hypothetical protein [Planctomycetota bacterium]MBI3843376.1 hypothetical protein [Planctomycetota bacterium]